MWKKRKTDWLEDAEYAPYITPMVLAAKLEQIEAINVLRENASSFNIHHLTGKICLSFLIQAL